MVVGRHKQPEIRDRILDACVDHALAHGLPDRLEPFVKASGCSTRMLIYHFGTRDALLREFPIGDNLPGRPWIRTGYGLGVMMGVMQGCRACVEWPQIMVNVVICKQGGCCREL